MQKMQDENRLDLESRKSKSPGGYNYPLYESGLPFIFMNSTNSLHDLVTIVHEGGHAVQSIVDIPLKFVDFKDLPSEVAELASMSMELISMEHWDVFFNNPQDLKRARIKHLQDLIKVLPWIAAVDSFQHWIYLNPKHTVAERSEFWNTTIKKFSSNNVNWEGFEDVRANLWQKQLHIFEVPFYYIEYGFAQLGAIAVWQNYRKDKQKTIQEYLKALSLGYTKPIGEIYKEAGIRFDFSEAYIKQLIQEVRSELDQLN
jgi:oligoendopeptidase F